MRIFITTMDEPLYANPYIKEIVDRRKRDIVGIAVSKGTPVSTRKKIDIKYAIALCLIVGIKVSFRNLLTILMFRAKKTINKFLPFVSSSSILAHAKNLGIPAYEVTSVQDGKFLQILKKSQPDIIINQAQEIFGKEFLNIPKIGCLGRHSGLLPKNRGLLAPFWVLLHKENRTGVSIQFVRPGIDEGDVIEQEEIAIEPDDDFLTLVRKCYNIAPSLVLRALDKIESGNYRAIHQDPSMATYNKRPMLKDALAYRKLMRQRKKR